MSSNAYCLSGRARKRVELAGDLRELEARTAQLRANLFHLDATIRLLDPAAEPDAIRPKRIVQRDGWFGPGELPRLVLDTLRTAAEPLPERALTEAIMLRRGMPPGDRATLLVVEKRVDRYLRRHDGRLLERVVHGPRVVGWKIAG
jgi:hypothetical protein